MEQKRRLLLVEDLQIQYESLKIQLEAADWVILRAVDEDSAIREIEFAEDEEWPIEIAVIDLGLPPGVDNPMRGGLPLIEKLRFRQKNLPILAYTSIQPASVDYDYLVAKLIPLRVSFVYLRRMVGLPSFANLVEIVWKEYFLLSPVPADHLHTSVADRPDPLNEELWNTLELLSANIPQKEVAYRLGNVSKDTVKNRVARIKEILIDAGELESFQTETVDIINWYRDHHIRFRRFPQQGFHYQQR